MKLNSNMCRDRRIHICQFKQFSIRCQSIHILLSKVQCFPVANRTAGIALKMMAVLGHLIARKELGCISLLLLILLMLIHLLLLLMGVLLDNIVELALLLQFLLRDWLYLHILHWWTDRTRSRDLLLDHRHLVHIALGSICGRSSALSLLSLGTAFLSWSSGLLLCSLDHDWLLLKHVIRLVLQLLATALLHVLLLNLLHVHEQLLHLEHLIDSGGRVVWLLLTIVVLCLLLTSSCSRSMLFGISSLSVNAC